MIGPRKVDKPLVLYGYGKLGHLAEEIFNKLKIPILTIKDEGSISDLHWAYEKEKEDVIVAVCVATEPFDNIRKLIQINGYTDVVPVWDIIEAYPEVGIHNGWFSENTDTDKGEALDLCRRFADHHSVCDYLDFCLWHQQRIEIPSIFKKEQGPSLPSTLADIRKRQVVKRRPDSNFFQSIIHAEGKELETLVVNIDLFKKIRPRLQVACYHSRDGLWKIEKFLMDNLPDYVWTFRLTAYMGQGAYIMGRPK